MYFAEESIKKMAADYAAVSAKRDKLIEAYQTRAYEVARAKQFAEHGVSRRLGTMVHCVENVFDKASEQQRRSTTRPLI